MEGLLKTVAFVFLFLVVLKALHFWLVEPLMGSLKTIQNQLSHISELLDQMLRKGNP